MSTLAPSRPRRLLVLLVCAPGIFAAALVLATLVLLAVDGHPEGLLAAVAGAAVPVVLWGGWRLTPLAYSSTRSALDSRLDESRYDIEAELQRFWGWMGSTASPTGEEADDLTVAGEEAARTWAKLLASHPEAPSVFSEASHRLALARQSATQVTQALAVARAARLRYEALRGRLDPRASRTVYFGAATAVLAVIFGGWMVLSAIEFTGVITGWPKVAAAGAAAAVWAGCAWLAALAGQQGRRGLRAVIWGGTAALAFFLGVLHAHGVPLGRADLWYGFGTGLLIFALVFVAAVLIARTEPVPLLRARHHWRRANSNYEAAVSVQHSDEEAAAVALQRWRDLVQAQGDAAQSTGRETGTGSQPSGEPGASA